LKKKKTPTDHVNNFSIIMHMNIKNQKAQES